MQASPASSTLPSMPIELSPPPSGHCASRSAHDIYERERLLIVQDLHDGLVQHISAAILFLEASRTFSTANPQKSETSWEKGMNLLTRSGTELRQLIHRLQPAILDQGGVVVSQ